MSAQISSDQAQQRTLLIQPSRHCVQLTTDLVLRKNIEYCGLDGAFLTHCWLRWLRGVLLQWNDPKHTRNHRIRPVENQDSSILFNVLQVHGRTLARPTCAVAWSRASSRPFPCRPSCPESASASLSDRPTPCAISWRVSPAMAMPGRYSGARRPSGPRRSHREVVPWP